MDLLGYILYLCIWNYDPATISSNKFLESREIYIETKLRSIL